MKKFLRLLPFLFAQFAFASDPANFTNWIFNLDATTKGHWSYTVSGGGSGYVTANLSKLQYDSTYIYVSAYGCPAYNMVFPQARYPGEQSYVLKFPRTPSVQGGPKTAIPKGIIGFWIDGVPFYHPGDGRSYSVSAGADSGSGDGIWNDNAVTTEAGTTDTCLGHTSGTSPGKYHTHQDAKCLMSYFGDTGSAHSPLLGWAYDGYPVYGPYGYSSALDSSSGVRRMVSGYTTSLQAGDTRTNGPNVTSSGQYSAGWYLEDFSYTGGGDLDQYNGRYCVTPEYPSGTYAYFVSIDASGNSAYPYVIGTSYYGALPQGFNSTSQTVPNGAIEYQPSCPVTVTPSSSAAAPSTSLTASVADVGTGGSYSWSITNGTITAGSSSRTVTFTTNASGLTTTVTCTVRTPHGCKASGSGDVTASSLPTPTGFSASLNGATSAALSWGSVSGAALYVIYRRTPTSGGWQELNTTANLTYTDSPLSANSAYLYAVQAANAGRTVVSSNSLPDFVTTFGYTDSPATAQSTTIKATHVTELRSAIDALYATLGFTVPTSWTDTSLTDVQIKATHFNELRSNLNTFRNDLLLSSTTFTDTLTAQSTNVRALHLSELRVAVKGYCSTVNCQ